MGDRVWLFVLAMKKGKTKKLASLWRDPYTVVDKTSPVNYRIKLVGVVATLWSIGIASNYAMENQIHYVQSQTGVTHHRAHRDKTRMNIKCQSGQGHFRLWGATPVLMILGSQQAPGISNPDETAGLQTGTEMLLAIKR